MAHKEWFSIKSLLTPVLEQRGEDKPLESGDNVTYGTIQRTAKWKIKAEKRSGVKLERSPGKRPLKTVYPILGNMDFHQHSGNQWKALSSNTSVKWIWMDYSVCFIKYRFEGRKSIGNKTVRGFEGVV